MQTLINARSVANFALSLSDFDKELKTRTTYTSMGALLIDAVLQSGLNYKSVVCPRVEHFVANFPTVKECSEFLDCLKKNGAAIVLQWTHSEKINRLIELTKFLIFKGVETVKKLGEWICLDGSRDELLGLRGIGEKTVDYIAMLAGVSSIPIDRHFRRFITAAGVNVSIYSDYRKVAEFAADLMKMPRPQFDYSVWSYVSSGKLS